MLIAYAVPQRNYWSLDSLSAAEAQALLASASALKHARRGARPLAGKHLAVLCEAGPSTWAQDFGEAARALGATATLLRPSASRIDDIDEARRAAPMLGRLYDGIVCDGLDRELTLELARGAAVPVFNAVVADGQPIRLFAQAMTMCELSGKPLAHIVLCVGGDPHLELPAAWARMAALTGIQLRHGAEGDFVLDAQSTAQGLAVLSGAGVGQAAGEPIEIRAQANHSFVVQALLAATLH